MSEITKRALEQSLKNLLNVKPLSKITISDIANDCGINRMTFYYHFRDIYDLIEWCCIEDAKKVLDSKNKVDNWQQNFLRIFQFVAENKSFVLNVYHSLSRDQIEYFLYQITYKLILDVVEEKSKEYNVKDEHKEFIANFYKFAFVGIIIEWVRDYMKRSPEKIVKEVDCLISGTIDKALESFQCKNFG